MSELSRCSLRPSSAERGSVGDRRASGRISLGHAAIALNREEVAGIDRQRKEAGRQRKESDHRRGVEARATARPNAPPRRRPRRRRCGARARRRRACCRVVRRRRPRATPRPRGLESCRRRARPRVTRRQPTRRRRRPTTTSRPAAGAQQRRRTAERRAGPAAVANRSARARARRCQPHGPGRRPVDEGLDTDRRGSRACSRFAAPATATGRRSP